MKVELHNVSKRFGRVAALQEVNATIESGRRVALVGPNGSGKSTLVRIITGLIRPRGDVRIGGLSPFRDRLELARRIACVPQIAPRLNATVGELVHTVTAVREGSLDHVASIAEHLGLDLSTVRRQAFRHLSGGTRQKVLISLALASRAEMLILDEPTASLDATARDRFYSLFDQEAGDATLILCSHRLDEIRHMVDHVLALDDGRVVRDGPASEILEGQTASVIEVCIRNGDHADWLREQGFHRGREGWWAQTVSHVEKMRLLPLITDSLGSQLDNLLIRDLETITVESASAESGSAVPASAANDDDSNSSNDKPVNETPPVEGSVHA